MGRIFRGYHRRRLGGNDDSQAILLVPSIEFCWLIQNGLSRLVNHPGHRIFGIHLWLCHDVHVRQLLVVRLQALVRAFVRKR